MKLVGAALVAALVVGACGPEFSLGPQQDSSLTPALERPVDAPPGGGADPSSALTPRAGRDCTRRRSSIVVGSVIVQSGPGASFLGAAPTGSAAAIRTANADGGVCGRLVNLTARDAGGDVNRGAAFVRAFAGAGAVALLGVEDAAAVETMAQADLFDDLRLPVVGSAGRSAAEFSSSWVFPVGTRPAIYGGAALAHAYAMGARRFIVLTERGTPGSDDLIDGIARAASEHEDAVVIQVESTSTADRQRYDLACADGCDAVVVATSPAGLVSWLAARPAPPAIATMLPEAMIGPTFVSSCGATCGGFLAFSSFELPLDEGDPAHVRFLREVRSYAPTADEIDVGILRSWVGAAVLVDALRLIDGKPSARAVRSALRAGSFDTGLTARPLRWHDGPMANRSVRPYALRYRGDTFVGYEPASSWYTLAP